MYFKSTFFILPILLSAERVSSGIKTGGITNRDPNEPQFKQLAEESLQKYLKTNGITQPHMVIRVEKATDQLVAGTMTRLDFTVMPIYGYSADVIRCHSEIWDRPWLNKKEIKVDCKLNNRAYRGKRQITGGVTNMNPNDPEVKKLAEESLQKYLQTNGIIQPHMVVRVEKATTQLVAGTLTVLDFIVMPIYGYSGDVIRCHSKILDQPWNGKPKIDVDCKLDNRSYRGKRQTPGGTQNQNPNNPEFRRLAEESLQKYLQTNGIRQPHRVIRVEKASVQVVAGTLTKLDFIVKPLYGNTGDVSRCHSEVWQRPWLGKDEINVNCRRIIY